MLSNVRTTSSVPFGAGSLWMPVFFLGLSIPRLHMVNYQFHTALAKKGFFSVLHLQSKVIP